MKRLLSAALLAALSFCARADSFEEGVHYIKLAERQPTHTGDKVEVLELFWYRCPHCFSLEKPLEAWLPRIPDNAEYVAMPAILGESWEFHARVFYIFEALGITDRFHSMLFEAIHVERKRLNDIESIAQWIEDSGGPSRTMVEDTFGSFAVDSRTRNSLLMTQRYRITGVPSVVVGGQYLTTVTMAGNHENLFKVIEYLIEISADEKTS